MHPLLFGAVPLYFLTWVTAALTGVIVGAVFASRAGYPACRSAIALALLALSILVGSKALYLAEAQFFPFDDYVPPDLRGIAHGFRIPGGILALAIAMPIVCRFLDLPRPRFGDAIIPLAALALVFIRLGCFLNGCCFGTISALPWAVRFPRGSWAFWYHGTNGWLAASAKFSHPVHPLQLYFLVAAALTFALLLWQQGRRHLPGYIQLLFYGLFFGSTAALEPFRQNPLTLNSCIVPAAALVAAALLFGRAIAAAPQAALAPSEPMAHRVYDSR